MAEKETGGMTRREFLIKAGGFAGLAIAGWYLLPRVFSRLTGAKPSEDGSKPALKECFSTGDTSEGTEIYLNRDGIRELVGKVNDIGGRILHEMNGSNTVGMIAEKVSSEMGNAISDAGSFTGKVALFVARLAEAGFLYAPFYVNISESEVTT